MISRNPESSRSSQQHSPAGTPHGRDQRASSPSSESSHGSSFGPKNPQQSPDTSLDTDERQSHKQHQNLIARAKKEEASPLLGPDKTLDKLSFSRTSPNTFQTSVTTSNVTKPTERQSISEHGSSGPVQGEVTSRRSRVDEAFSTSSSGILSGEKRPRQPSPPQASSSRLRLDDYEEPKPLPKKSAKFFQNLISSLEEKSSPEEKSAKAAQVISSRMASNEAITAAKKKQLLPPNDAKHRRPDFGLTFASEEKEVRIIRDHPDLGLKTPQEVRDFVQKFWQLPLSSDVIERSQKNGSLIRLDQKSGIVAVADIDIPKPERVQTKTIFNPGLSRFSQEPETKQRKKSLEYFLRQ